MIDEGIAQDLLSERDHALIREPSPRSIARPFVSIEPKEPVEELIQAVDSAADNEFATAWTALAGKLAHTPTANLPAFQALVAAPDARRFLVRMRRWLTTESTLLPQPRGVADIAVTPAVLAILTPYADRTFASALQSAHQYLEHFGDRYDTPWSFRVAFDTLGEVAPAVLADSVDDIATGMPEVGAAVAARARSGALLVAATSTLTESLALRGRAPIVVEKEMAHPSA